MGRRSRLLPPRKTRNWEEEKKTKNSLKNSALEKLVIKKLKKLKKPLPRKLKNLRKLVKRISEQNLKLQNPLLKNPKKLLLKKPKKPLLKKTTKKAKKVTAKKTKKVAGPVAKKVSLNETSPKAAATKKAAVITAPKTADKKKKNLRKLN